MLAISRFSAPLAVFIFNAGVAVAEPVTVAIAKAPVERLVARGRCEPVAHVWTIEIERRHRREYRRGPLDQSQSRLPRRNVDHVDADDPVSRHDRPN
jgi:hypothetical protein